MWKELAKIKHENEVVLQLCSGGRTPAEIAKASGLGAFQTRIVLRRLRNLHLIE